ncbi:MAG: hypothetical protein HY247_06630 [archaeon]|nr:MAG: hypothetical protein HY247_06630 [archaeon]
MEGWTNIEISRETLGELTSLQRSYGSSTLDETIRLLVHRYKQDVLKSISGADKGKITSFTEQDRGEDRD